MQPRHKTPYSRLILPLGYSHPIDRIQILIRIKSCDDSGNNWLNTFFQPVLIMCDHPLFCKIFLLKLASTSRNIESQGNMITVLNTADGGPDIRAEGDSGLQSVGMMVDYRIEIARSFI